MKKFIQISLIILGLVTCVSAYAQTTITPDNSNLQYQGRIDFTDPTAPVFIWPATSVKLKFTGTAVSLLMTDNYSDGGTYTNYYDIILDNKIIKSVGMSNTKTQYQLVSNLVNKEHVIEIFKRTECGPCVFNGFIITGTMLTLDPMATRKIEIIGDAYACGYGNEKSYVNPSLTPGYHSVNEDADSAFGAILSRRFDSQYMCTATTGTGMYRNNFPTTGQSTAPALYNQLSPYDASSSWDHSNYTPDLMIIFIGGNDFVQEAPGNSEVMLDSASFVDTYISFINTIKGLNPGIKIVIMCGAQINDSNPVGKFWLTRWRNYMAAINDHFAADGNVYKFEILPLTSPYGEDWHASKANHVEIADQLTPAIQNIMQWSVGNTTYDCNGVLGGSARIDCSVCAGGNTNFTDCLSTGITNANTKPEINMYPNPTTDIISFDDEQKWELFDAVGKTLFTGEGKEISLKNLSNGVYLIKLENSTSLIRIVKV